MEKHTQTARFRLRPYWQLRC